MARKKRVFICAHPDDRCKYVITLSDKSKADCGRRHVDGAMRHNLKPWQMRLYGMIAEELTQPEADHV